MEYLKLKRSCGYLDWEEEQRFRYKVRAIDDNYVMRRKIDEHKVPLILIGTIGALLFIYLMVTLLKNSVEIIPRESNPKTCINRIVNSFPDDIDF